MSKKRESLFKHVLMTVLIVALSLFAYVFLIEETKRINREISKSIEILEAKKSQYETKFVEYQKLTGENRITKIAQERLNLVRNMKTSQTINIDSNQIERLKKLVNEKYD
ncbi:MAG: hypothetical protein K9J12_08540 [Melioribacteraceae bacterium]|nr:hypothetical protein [Melioribacteraceae bacterium]MCF8266090.1 hypothetical protein [Melioribacteraceae bacterium]MCF8412197.1 hypothetical protein [Melioribacteraceae bacterium]MCF8432797.1 hypothetical protein [Melioribacteraceae bacterium]